MLLVQPGYKGQVERPQWNREEARLLEEMRSALGDKLTRRAQYPDLVGDRRLLRFLRGTQYNVLRACEKYSKFLDWRDAHSVDAIRNDILHGGRNDPRIFPGGAKILQSFPQIVIAANARDMNGNPVSVDRFNFSPTEALKNVTKEEYRIFAIYCLEYKVLVMEQLARQQEQEDLKERSTCSADSNDPYGVIPSSFYIRDFEGFSLDHLGGDGQSLLAWVLEMATANYPELLYQTHLVNVPWIFNFLWVFIRPFLDASTIAKIHIHGYGSNEFLEAVKDKISEEAIPDFLGGKMVCENDAFEFDLSPTGPFHFAPLYQPPPQPPLSTQIASVCDERPVVSEQKVLPRPLEHRLLMNPYAWLLYLRIVVLVPVASVFTRVHGHRPVLSAAVLGAMTVSASTLINHFLHSRDDGRVKE